MKRVGSSKAPIQKYEPPPKKAKKKVSLGKRITSVGEGLSVAGLAGLGVQSSLHNALHRHMYEHDGVYKRSYDAHLKARKNAVNRLVKKHGKNLTNVMKIMKGGTNFAKGAAKTASKVKV